MIRKSNASENRVASSYRYGTLLLVLLLMSSGMALAVNVTVDCDATTEETEFFFSNLNNAINSFMNREESHTIDVSGTCENPGPEADPQRWFPFTVRNFNNLTIQGDATLSQPAIACDQPNDGSTGDRLRDVLRITDSARVNLRGLTIQGGEGVSVSNSAVFFDGDVTVFDSRRRGVSVGGPLPSLPRCLRHLATP